LQSKKEQDDYAYDLHEVARIWTRGCIIRSELMETLAESLKIQPDILFQEETQKAVQEYRPALEAVVIEALRNNQAIPALSAALNYLNGITTADSPAHLIQAQRDYFGAHKYQKRNDSSQNFIILHGNRPSLKRKPGSACRYCRDHTLTFPYPEITNSRLPLPADQQYCGGLLAGMIRVRSYKPFRMAWVVPWDMWLP